MGSNMNRLGEVLVDKMRRTSAAAVRPTVELGTINGNLSLTTDGLRRQIPKGEYMVNLMLTDSSNSLKSGDRVLVVWCGGEPVIVAIVVSS